MLKGSNQQRLGPGSVYHGKAKNKHKGPGGRGDFGGTGGTGKSIVVGAVKRKGNVVARVIDKADGETLNRLVRETISTKVSLISTDEHKGYQYIDKNFPHGVVRHSQDLYVNEFEFLYNNRKNDDIFGAAIKAC
jgi:transposase-like protein